MAEIAEKTSTAMLFERNDRLVIEAFQRGEFDYLEGVGSGLHSQDGQEN
ncbi:MAG: hypothetical protein HZA08_07940 [Nitrospirae bacterium]|nr:hypothetical protein [Nitrospirota bacterium]